MSTQPPTPQHSRRAGTWNAIWLIAQREIVTRAKTKSFVITTALIMVVIIAGTIVLSILQNSGGDDAEHVGLVGGAPGLSETIEATGEATGTTIDVVALDTEAQARDQVSNGNISGAILPGDTPDSFVLISDDGLQSQLENTLRAGIDQFVFVQGLAAEGVDVSTLAQATITTETSSTPDPDIAQRIVIAIVGLVLLTMAIMIGGQMVSMGVVEEKTSRVVEILLATITPLQLLWGKILGIGIISLGQILILGTTALISGTVTGVLTIGGTAIWMFVTVIVWFLLGYLFFSTLFAATGALVSRQEELGSANMPLTLLSMAMVYSGAFGIQALDSTFMQTLTWIPPFSAAIMPIRVATGDTNALQITLTLIIMVLACAAATWVSARIYQRSILRTGSRVKWSEALKMARS